MSLPEPLSNNAETRKLLSVHHGNILAYAEAMYYDRGHRDVCWSKYEDLTRHLAAADMERTELLQTLKLVSKALTGVRLASTDQNPHGFRDAIGAAITKAEGA